MHKRCDRKDAFQHLEKVWGFAAVGFIEFFGLVLACLVFFRGGKMRPSFILARIALTYQSW